MNGRIFNPNARRLLCGGIAAALLVSLTLAASAATASWPSDARVSAPVLVSRPDPLPTANDASLAQPLQEQGRSAATFVPAPTTTTAALAGSTAAAGDAIYVGSPVAISPEAGLALGSCETRAKEGEVSLAADPRDSRRLIAAWIQRVSDNDAPTNLVGTSDDGGRTWSRTGVPGMTRCTGTGGQDAAIDPFVAIGGDGRSYLSSIGAYGGANDVQANWSDDVGKTWSDVVVVDGHTTGGNDFPPIVADPNLGGQAYIVHPHFPGGIFMSRTTDGGRSWAPNLLPVAGPGAGVRTAPQLVVLRDNTMIVEFIDATGPTEISPETVFTTRSRDGGFTWSPATPLTVLPGFTDPRAVAGPDDTVYITWWNGGKVEIVRSSIDSDGNLVWSAPVTVADASRTLRGPGPAVAVDATGTVGVLWYEMREDGTTTDVWFARSNDRGERWTKSHVAGPFDLASVGGGDPVAGSFQLGDYVSLVPLKVGFGAAFGLGVEGDNPTDIFYSHIGNRAAGLSVTNTDSPDPVLAGANVSYRITVRNGGPDTATEVRVKDTLPAETPFVSAGASQGTCSGTGTVSCSLGSIAAGAEATLDIVAKTTKTGTLTNTASVSGNEVDLNGADNEAKATTTVNPAADLSVTKSDSPDPVHVGQTLTYTLLIRNAGPDAANSVTLEDDLPKNAGYGTPTTTQGSCTLKPEKRLLACSLGTIGAGGSATVTVAIKPSGRGTITNKASVKAASPPDPDLGNNTSTADTVVR